MKITYTGRYYLDGSPLTITWEDGNWSIAADPATTFTAGTDLEAQIAGYRGEYVKAPWGPVRADPKTPDGFFVLAAALFAEEPTVEGWDDWGEQDDAGPVVKQ